MPTFLETSAPNVKTSDLIEAHDRFVTLAGKNISPARRRRVEYCIERTREALAPRLPRLAMKVILSA